jgi:photosystem II stability/assembly factor-like uncharacterized protein
MLQTTQRARRLAGGLALIVALIVVGLLWHTFASGNQNAQTGATAATHGAQAGDTGSGALVIQGHLLLTVDGGAHWHEVTPPALSPNRVLQAAFLDGSTGYAVGAQMNPTDGTSTVSVYATQNGGASWSRSILPAFHFPNASVSSIGLLDAHFGWLVVDLTQTVNERTGMLFTTADEGKTWEAHSIPFSVSVWFRDASDAWLVGGHSATMQNLLYTTHDGGSTWQPQSLPKPASSGGYDPVLSMPAFFSTQNGLIAATYGSVVGLYTTKDGGNTWALSSTAALSDLDSMAPPILARHGTSAWLVAGHTLLITHDGGQNWIPQAHSASLIGVQALQFVSDKTGWALISNGSCQASKSNCSITNGVLRTTDGGQTWAPIMLPAVQ